MKTTRIIYLKNKPREDTSLYFPNYYKVVETDEMENSAKVLTVDKNTINFEASEDFFEEVSFIKNTLCVGNIGSDGCEEITREDFDAFYKKTISRINNLSSL